MDADQNVDLVQQLFFPVPGRPALVLPCLNQVCVSQVINQLITLSISINQNWLNFFS